MRLPTTLQQPDFAFLKQRCRIGDTPALQTALQDRVAHTDLSLKQRDFEHLLFDPHKSTQILHFMEILFP